VKQEEKRKRLTSVKSVLTQRREERVRQLSLSQRLLDLNIRRKVIRKERIQQEASREGENQFHDQVNEANLSKREGIESAGASASGR